MQEPAIYIRSQKINHPERSWNGNQAHVNCHHTTTFWQRTKDTDYGRKVRIVSPQANQHRYDSGKDSKEPAATDNSCRFNGQPPKTPEGKHRENPNKR